MVDFFTTPGAYRHIACNLTQQVYHKKLVESVATRGGWLIWNFLQPSQGNGDGGWTHHSKFCYFSKYLSFTFQNPQETKLWLLCALHVKLIKAHKVKLPPKLPNDRLQSNDLAFKRLLSFFNWSPASISSTKPSGLCQCAVHYWDQHRNYLTSPGFSFFFFLIKIIFWPGSPPGLCNYRGNTGSGFSSVVFTPFIGLSGTLCFYMVVTTCPGALWLSLSLCGVFVFEVTLCVCVFHI